METLVINIPESKSKLVKQILKQFGVTFKKKQTAKKKPSDYAGMLSHESADKILKEIAQSRTEWERNI